MTNMVGSATVPVTTASVQPLPSNMVNKTFQMETQYMQQQSQIFVFSTALANKAAESYVSGHFPSMIAFHCSQPGTKSFLEKYPLKVQQFNRQNPAAWLNNLAQMKQTGRQMKNSVDQFPGPQTMNDHFPGPSNTSVMNPCSGSYNMHMPGVCSGLRGPSSWPPNCNNIVPSVSNEFLGQSWPGQHLNTGTNMSSMNHKYPVSIPQGMNIRSMGPTGNSLHGCMNNFNPNICGPPFQNQGLNPMQMNRNSDDCSTLTGVKVPNESLTPQQRQHREEQLAMIRKMQQVLFPELQLNNHPQGGLSSNVGQSSSDVNTQTRYNSVDACAHSVTDAGISPHQTCRTDQEQPRSHMHVESPLNDSSFPHHNFSNCSASAQSEWQKLQHQFYEERRRKQESSSVPISHPSSGTQLQQSPVQTAQSLQSLSQPESVHSQNLNCSSPNMRLSPGIRMAGLPPPYHQTNRRTIQSPHPVSPTSSSLSLPSPRVTSGLPSPADSSRQFPQPTPPGPRLPHPSPGSSTPVGGNSLHTTPLNSPKPLNCVTPSTNSATLTKTSTTPTSSVPTPTSTPTSSCTPVLPNSGQSIPLSSCINNPQQNPSCSSESQDSNLITSTGSTNSDFPSSSCTVSVSKPLSGSFCNNSHSCPNQSTQNQENCSDHNLGQKEPSLMPVPSPQQIQYQWLDYLALHSLF